MSDERFEELLSDLLDGEPSADGVAELVRLAKDHPAREQEIQTQLEAAEMIALAEDDLRNSELFEAALQSRISEDPFVARARLQMKLGGRLIRPRFLLPWAVAAAAMIAFLAIGVVPLLMTADVAMAELVDIQGPFRWIGEDGDVETELRSGRALRAGTIDSLAPDAWATLRFPDATSVTLSGLSSLTITATGGEEQKIWNLRRGELSGRVSPQPDGRPVLMYTPAAVVRVPDTRFRLTADADRTAITVNWGEARVERLADRRSVDVPADYRTVASVDVTEELRVLPREEPTSTWRADLEEQASHGGWIDYLTEYRRWLGGEVEAGRIARAAVRRRFAEFAAELTFDGGVRAAPRPLGENVIYAVVLTLAGNQTPPVVLSEGSRFRISGRVQQPTELVVGLGVSDLDGTSRARAAARPIPVEGKFEVVLPLADFRARGGAVMGKELFTWLGFTGSGEAQLEITNVELLGPEQNEANR